MSDDSREDTEFFQEHPDEKPDPFTTIPNELIRDETVSPQCRWLLIYLLSNKKGWNINLRQIINHLKPHRGYGRESVRTIVNEAIAAGYMKKTARLKGNLRQGFIYYISKSKAFSNNFSDNPDSGLPNPGQPQTGLHKKEHTSSKEEDKKEHIEEKEASPTSAAKALPSASSKRKKIKEEFIEVTERVSLTKSQSQSLLEKANGNEDLVRSWANKLSEWKIGKGIVGGSGDYQAILNWVIKAVDGTEQINENLKFAKKMHSKYKDFSDMVLDKKGVVNGFTGKDVPFNLPNVLFRERLCGIFGGQYDAEIHGV